MEFSAGFGNQLIHGPNNGTDLMREPVIDTETDDILRCCVRALPFFHKMVAIDHMIGVSDGKKFVGFAEGDKMRPPENVVGKPIPPGDPIEHAARTGKEYFMTMPTEVFGFPFKGSGIPITDKYGRIVGALGMAMSLEHQNKLYQAAQSISSASEQISGTSQELAGNAIKLAGELENIKTMCETVLAQIKKTDDILSFINSIAFNSNILGLNAAIEAARAGEKGKGFGVVADEIRKMAVNSGNSINDINDILTNIKSQFGELISRINSVSALGESQAAASEEISSSMTELTASTDNILNVAKIV